MALLESSIAEVFLLPDSIALTNEKFKEMTFNQFKNMELNLRMASKLIEFEYDCEEYLQNFKAGNMHSAIPEKRKNYLFVYRNNNKVIRKKLSAAEFSVIKNLGNGLSVHEAITSSMSNTNISDEIQKTIQNQFFSWINAGFFTT